MANKRYTLKHRRRREGKTNYHKRLRLLVNRTPRLVVRRSNTEVIVQIVDYSDKGDVIKAQMKSKDLTKHGWKHSSKNLPAAYLTGYLVGVAAVKQGIKKAIVDIGMQTAHHGGRLFAAVKGALDAGLDIPVSESTLPSDERLMGEHIDAAIGKSVEAVKGKVK